MSYEYRNKRIIENFARRYTTNVSDEVDILFELEHVYSQAAKADEYEAKAKTYTKLVSQISAVDAIVAINYDEDMTDTNLHLLMLGAEVKRFFESGESDE